MKATRNIRERFYEKTTWISDCGCLIWTASCDTHGYGQFFTGRRSASGYKVPAKASRAAWMIERGEIPPGMDVCHRCDNPLCVNINHLFLGTPKQNAQDMVAKGRCRSGASMRARTHCRYGHPFDNANTSMRQTPNGLRRFCRACGRENTNRYRLKKPKP